MTKPDLTTTSNVLGAALIGAAMALPCVQIAYGDAPPERGIISFKYLHYQEHQSADEIPATSTTSTSTGNDRDDDDRRTNNVISTVSNVNSVVNLVSGASGTHQQPLPEEQRGETVTGSR